MTRPLDVVATLLLESGTPWLDAATDVQIGDMVAWQDDHRPFHYCTRARGYGKTSDAAAFALGVIATDPAARVDVLAADQAQGNLVLQSIEGYLDRDERLHADVAVTSNLVRHADGGRLEILPADAPGIYGRRPTLTLVDELAQWAETERALKLWQAVSTSVPKIPGSRLIVATTAGDPRHFSHKLLEHARRSALWRTSETPYPAPWQDPGVLADLRAQHPPAIYDRLFRNLWTAAGDFLDAAMVDRAFSLSAPVTSPPPGTFHTYVAGLDLGLVNDASALSIGHREGDCTFLDLMLVWQGSRAAPVNLREVGGQVADLARAFRFTLFIDPWQGEDMRQRLVEAGVDARQFRFTASSKEHLASTLLGSINTPGAVALYQAPGLRDELVGLRVKQKARGLFTFDHAADGHDDRAVSLALMLVASMDAEPGDVVELSYQADAFAAAPIIRRDDLVFEGDRFQDETGELDGDGEPLRQPPPGWQALDENPYQRGRPE